MKLLRILVVLGCSLCISGANEIIKIENSPQTKPDLAVSTEIGELLTGVDRVWAGHVSFELVRWGTGYKEESKGSFTFDRPKASWLYVFDVVNMQNEQSVGLGVTCLVNQEDSFQYAHGGSTVVKDSPDVRPRSDLYNPFDFRCVGLVSHGEWDRKRTFESTCEFLLQPEHQVVIENSVVGGETTLTWIYSLNTGQKVRRSVIFDAQQENVPVSMNMTMGAIDGRPVGPEYLEFSGTTRWAKVDGEFVPVVWSYEGSNRLVGGELSLDWAMVNMPTSDSQFSFDAMRLPPGTHIVNSRLGAENAILESITPGSNIASMPVSLIPPAKSRLGNYILIGNVSVLLIVVLIYGVSRRKKLGQRI